MYSGTASNMTTMSGSNYYGEHLTLQLPHSIVLKSYSYTSHLENWNRCGNTWVVGGSVNGTNWDLLDTRSNISWSSSNETKTFTTSNNTAYSYYRMLALVVGNAEAPQYRDDWGIAEWRLYGYSNPQISPTGTTTREGQVNMNCEVISTNRTMFNRPITMRLRSATDLSTMCNWSAELTVREL